MICASVPLFGALPAPGRGGATVYELRRTIQSGRPIDDVAESLR